VLLPEDLFLLSFEMLKGGFETALCALSKRVFDFGILCERELDLVTGTLATTGIF